MKYLDFLKLILKFGDVIPQALAIVERIAEDFSLLVELFSSKAAGKVTAHTAPFMGTEELAMEQAIADRVAKVSAEGKPIPQAINFARIRDIFLALKQAGALDALVSILTRLL